MKLALAVIYLLNPLRILLLSSYKAIDIISNSIITITNPSSVAVLVSASNTNISRSSAFILLNGFSLKSLSKYYLADAVLKVIIRSLLHL